MIIFFPVFWLLIPIFFGASYINYYVLSKENLYFFFVFIAISIVLIGEIVNLVKLEAFTFQKKSRVFCSIVCSLMSLINYVCWSENIDNYDIFKDLIFGLMFWSITIGIEITINLFAQKPNFKKIKKILSLIFTIASCFLFYFTSIENIKIYI